MFKGLRASGLQGMNSVRAYREIIFNLSPGHKGTIFSLSELGHAMRYYACTKLPGVCDLHSEVGRHLALHVLRADPSGLVR